MNRPSVDECIQGFERILDKINRQQMMMLRAHYHSAGRAATMRELATAAGYADFKMANLQYGNLAKRLYQAIGYPKPKSPRSGKEYWILGLGEFIGRHEFGLEMQCVMRPEVAEALERLGIVDYEPSNQRSDIPTAINAPDEWLDVIENRGDHYFLYWQERSVLDHAANELPLDVVASNGLFGVEGGDTLWIVTLTQEREFFLAGRMVVGEIVEYEEAIRRMPDAGLWQAEYYAFPEPETEEFLRPIPLTEIAEELRFDGDNDRLTIRDGQINPQQLRQRRKLTRESAELVTRIWEESAPITDPEELVAAWQEVVEAHPDDPQAHYNLAVALDEVNRNEEAIREYQTTILLDPNYFPALYNVGNYLVHSRRFDEAIEMFNRAILVDGDYAPVHFMLAVAYFESGRFEDAIAATRQGLEIDPNDESAYYNIAYWTFQQGDHRGAIARCEDVIARFPYYTSPHVLKGMCFRELGELDNEIQSYKNAIDIKVDDEGALIVNFTAVFFLGAAWEHKITGSDEGIEYINADNHVDLEDPTHQFCFAMGHLAQGEREFADRWIEGLRTAAPDLVRRLEIAIEYSED